MANQHVSCHNCVWLLSCITNNVNSLQCHFTTSESTMQGYIQEVDRLKQELLDNEKTSCKLQEDIKVLKKGLGDAHNKLERQNSVTKSDKVNRFQSSTCLINHNPNPKLLCLLATLAMSCKSFQNHLQDISERLRNSEDKLVAAEHIKQLLNEEVVTLQQAFEKMSEDFEVSFKQFVMGQCIAFTQSHPVVFIVFFYCSSASCSLLFLNFSISSS